MHIEDRGNTRAIRLVTLLKILTELSLQKDGITTAAVQRQLRQRNITVSNRTVSRDLDWLTENGVLKFDVDGLLHVLYQLRPVEPTDDGEERPPNKLISLTGKSRQREVFIDPSQVSSVITEGDHGLTRIAMKDRRTHLVIGEASDVAATINRERLRLEEAEHASV
jgi:hypothetical protein